MKRLTAALTTITLAVLGWITVTAAPAFAALCDGDPVVTYSKTTTDVNGHAYWTTIKYQVCWNSNTQEIVHQVTSWRQGYDLAGSKASCQGFGVFDGTRANFNFTDKDGHSFNPGAFTVPCQTDGRHSVVKTPADYGWAGRLHLPGDQWSDQITSIKIGLPDVNVVTHSGGFPVAP